MAKWWLVTWSTYGSWLPGDPRGFRTWRRREYVPPPKDYAQHDEVTYDPSVYSARYKDAKRKLAAPISVLDLNDRKIVCDALVTEIGTMRVVPSVLAVASSHVHFLSKFGETKIRPAVGRMKSAATRRLHDDKDETSRVWTKGCQMKSLATEDDFMRTFNYVNQHRDEGAVVYVWQANLGWNIDE